MKSCPLIFVLIILLSAFIQPADNKKIFKQLCTLEGSWIMKTSKGFVGEEWGKVSDKHLQNRGFIIKGVDTIVTETVALQHRENGIFYTSTVNGQNNQQPVSFTLTSANKGVFIFENPTHDYPERITYQLVSRDSLYAWIDGGKDQPENKTSFSYARAR